MTFQFDAIPHFLKSLAQLREGWISPETFIAEIEDARDEDIAEIHEEALSTLRQCGSQDDVLSGLRRAALALERLDREEEALSLYDEALGLEESITAKIHILLHRSRLMLSLRRPAGALVCSDEALELLSNCPDHEDGLVRAHCCRAEALYFLDRDDEAVAEFDVAVPLLDRGNLRHSAARAVRMQATSLAVNDFHERAAEIYCHAARRYEDLGDSNQFAECLQRAGQSFMALGRFEDALHRFDAAFVSFCYGADDEAIRKSLIDWSRAQAELGRHAEAAAGYAIVIERLRTQTRVKNVRPSAGPLGTPDEQMSRNQALAEELQTYTARMLQSQVCLVPELADPVDEPTRIRAWKEAQKMVQPAWTELQRRVPANLEPPSQILYMQSNVQAGERFEQRDYFACRQLIVPTTTTLHRSLLGHLLFISTQRLGDELPAGREATTIIEAFADTEWEQDLLRMTLGHVTSADLTKRAQTDKERCQVMFYRGQLALTRGNAKLAHQMFQECVDMEADCLESGLARAELKPESDLASVPAQAEIQRQLWRSIKEAVHLSDRGDREQAVVIAGRAVEEAERYLDSGNLLRARCQHILGVLYLEQGDMAAAEPLLHRSLSERQSLEPLGHPEYIHGLNALANLRRRTGRVVDAGKIYEQAVEDSRTGLAQNDAEHAAALEGRAWSSRHQGQYDQAQTQVREAIQILAKNPLSNAAGYGAIIHNLASLYVKVEDHSAAEQLLRSVGRFDVQCPVGWLKLACLRTLVALYGELAQPERVREVQVWMAELHEDTNGDTHLAGTYDSSEVISFAQTLAEYRVRHPHPWHWGDFNGSSDFGLPNVDGLETGATVEINSSSTKDREPDQVRQQVQQIYDRAHELAEAGRHAEAIDLFEEAVEFAREHVEPNRPDLGYCLRGLAESLEEAGDTCRALDCAKQSLTVLRRTCGEQHRATRNTWYLTARLLRKVGRREHAHQHVVRCIAIDRAHGPVYERALAGSLSARGTLLGEMNLPRDGLALLDEAFSIRQRVLGDGHIETLEVVLQMSDLMAESGLDADAGVYLQSFLDVCGRTREKNDLWTIEFRQRLGSRFLALNDLEGARPHFMAAYETRRELLGDDHPQTLQSFRAFLEVLVQLGRPEDMSAVTDFFLRLGQYCAGYLQDAERPDGNKIEMLYLMGKIMRGAAQHSTEESKFLAIRNLFSMTLNMAAEVYGESHPMTVRCMHELACTLYDLGEFPLAVDWLRRLLTEAATSNDIGYLSNLQTELACCLIANGELEEASTLLEIGAMMQEMQLSLVLPGTTDRQRELYLASVRTRLAVFVSFVAAHGPGWAMADREVFCRLLGTKGVALETAMATRSAILEGQHAHLRDDLDSLNRLKEKIGSKTIAGPDEGAEAHRAWLEKARAEYAQAETFLSMQVSELRFGRTSMHIDLDKIAAALPAGSALVEFVRYPSMNFKAVPARGEPRWAPARYAAFVLLAGESSEFAMIDLGEAEEIDRLIDGFRASVRRSGGRDLKLEPDGPETTCGYQLRAAVFDPLKEAFSDRTRLILAPDGNLTRLPFQVLPLNERNMLIDHYEISYVGTGRDVLRFNQENRNPPSRPMVLANPDFELKNSEPLSRAAPERQSRDLQNAQLRFNPLAGTLLEGEAVGRILGVTPLLDRAALKGPFKRIGPPPSIVHIATHGFFLEDQVIDSTSAWEGRLTGPLPEDPLLRSGLALAGANTFLAGGSLPEDAEDGLLTAGDVAAMNLLGTELVVLSACGTGLGEVRNGEGVFGLQRAFVLAGAKTLVMSLWSVPDEATRELMENFYSFLLAEKGRAESLKLAQLSLRERYSDPYYWGAFICQGDPDSLPIALLDRANFPPDKGVSSD